MAKITTQIHKFTRKSRKTLRVGVFEGIIPMPADQPFNLDSYEQLRNAIYDAVDGTDVLVGRIKVERIETQHGYGLQVQFNLFNNRASRDMDIANPERNFYDYYRF